MRKLLMLLLLMPAWTLPSLSLASDPTSGDLVLFPRLIHGKTWYETPARGEVLGWHIAGQYFRPGDGWWALTCQRECLLTSTHLSIVPAQHRVYDGPLVPSQFLQWSPIPFGLNTVPTTEQLVPVPGSPFLLAIFKPVRKLAGLKLTPGPIKTWLHSGMGNYPGTSNEVIIRSENGESTVLKSLNKIIKTSGNSDDKPVSTLIFELHDQGKKQQLGSYVWDIDGPMALGGTDYLLWAGDLDGDGKLDLLMNFTNFFWDTVLFLSSLAKPGELVGEGGRFKYSPPDASGC